VFGIPASESERECVALEGEQDYFSPHYPVFGIPDSDSSYKVFLCSTQEFYCDLIVCMFDVSVRFQKRQTSQQRGPHIQATRESWIVSPTCIYFSQLFISFRYVRVCALLLALFLIVLPQTVQAEDYYTILELQEDCAQEDIKKAYHRLALIYHPDKNMSPLRTAAEKAEQIKTFMKIQAAYELLSDPDKRGAYDGLRKGQQGGNSGGSSGAPPPGHENVKYHVRISLEHIFTGGNAEVELPVSVVCPYCGGSGAHRYTSIYKHRSLLACRYMHILIFCFQPWWPWSGRHARRERGQWPSNVGERAWGSNART